MMVKGRYDDATMKIAIWQKDMQVIGDFAKKIGAPVPLFAATRPVYQAALAGGPCDARYRRRLRRVGKEGARAQAKTQG